MGTLNQMSSSHLPLVTTQEISQLIIFWIMMDSQVLGYISFHFPLLVNFWKQTLWFFSNISTKYFVCIYYGTFSSPKIKKTSLYISLFYPNLLLESHDFTNLLTLTLLRTLQNFTNFLSKSFYEHLPEDYFQTLS